MYFILISYTRDQRVPITPICYNPDTQHNTNQITWNLSTFNHLHFSACRHIYICIQVPISH